MLFSVPLFFTSITDELFEFNKMVLTYFFATGILTCWLVQMILEKKFIFKRTYFDLPILIFVISQILSTIFSIHHQTSILGYYSRFHGGLLSTITYCTLYYAFVSNVSRKHLPSLFLSLFSSALLVSLYGILEHFGHSPSCLLITGNFDVSCWIQDVQTRVFATFGQPNWLAAYAITLLPLGVIWTVLLKKISQKLFAGVSTLSLWIVLLFTQSRSGFLGFLTSMAILLVGVFYLRTRKTSQTLPLVKNLAIFGTVFLLAGLLFGTPFTPKFSELTTSPKQEVIAQNIQQVPVNRLELGGTDSGEIRKIVWRGAFDIWRRYPILGSGVETFAYSYYLDRPVAHNLVSEWDFLYNKAHNEYLNLLATTGLVGFLAYCFLQLAVTRYTYSTIKDPQKNDDAYLALALFAGYVALSVSNFFGFSTVMVSILFFLFPALLVVLNRPVSQEAATKKPKTIESTLTTISYVQCTIVGLTSSILLILLFRYWEGDVLFTRGKAYLGAGEYQEGFSLIDQAISRNPSEALYYDTLADTYAQIAVQLHQNNQVTAAAEVTQGAIAYNNQTLQLNGTHLNFLKTAIRVYVTLSSIDTKYLQQAEDYTRLAITKAPTDAKLHFTLAQVISARGNTTEALEFFEKTVELKPNYEIAQQTLAETYLRQGDGKKATETAQYILEKINPSNERAQEIATYSAIIE